MGSVCTRKSLFFSVSSCHHFVTKVPDLQWRDGRAEHSGAFVCFLGKGHSSASVEEWELTHCLEDVYKVRTLKTFTKYYNAAPQIQLLSSSLAKVIRWLEENVSMVSKFF